MFGRRAGGKGCGRRWRPGRRSDRSWSSGGTRGSGRSGGTRGRSSGRSLWWVPPSVRCLPPARGWGGGGRLGGYPGRGRYLRHSGRYLRGRSNRLPAWMLLGWVPLAVRCLPPARVGCGLAVGLLFGWVPVAVGCFPPARARRLLSHSPKSMPLIADPSGSRRPVRPLRLNGR